MEQTASSLCKHFESGVIMKAPLPLTVGLLLLLFAATNSSVVTQTTILDFLHVFRGPLAIQDEAVLEVVPVDIPALRPEYTMAFKAYSKGRAIQLNILRVSAFDDRYFKIIRSYFSNPLQYPPQTTDLASLRNVQRSDLEERLECTVLLRPGGERGQFTADWPNCIMCDSGGHPSMYFVVWSCDKMIAYLGDSEYPVYALDLIGPKPPIVPSWMEGVSNYTRPCHES